MTMPEKRGERKSREEATQPTLSLSGGFSETGGSDFGSAAPGGSAIESPDAKMQFVHAREKRKGFAVYINSDSIGGRESPHGRSLMRNFLYTLTEIAPQPEAIILVNSAVRLARPGSAGLENLSLLHEQGVKIYVAEKSISEIDDGGDIAVGKAVTMHTILHALLSAEKVVSP